MAVKTKHAIYAIWTLLREIACGLTTIVIFFLIYCLIKGVKLLNLDVWIFFFLSWNIRRKIWKFYRILRFALFVSIVGDDIIIILKFLFFFIYLLEFFFLFKLSCFQNSLKGVLGLSLIALCKETESSLFLYCFVPDCWKRLLRWMPEAVRSGSSKQPGHGIL